MRPEHRIPWGRALRQRLASPYALLTGVALLWASNVVIGRAIAGSFPPVTLNLLRWFIALAALLPLSWPLLRGKAGLIRQRLPQLVILAIPSIAIYNAFIYLGTQTTSAANAGLIIATMPIGIMALAIPLRQEAASWQRMTGVAVSFLGVVWVICRGDPDRIASLALVPGDLFIVGSVLSWAVYSVLLRRFAIPLPPLALLTVLTVIGLLVTAPVALWEIRESEPIRWSGPVFAAVLYIGLFPSVIATLFWNRAVVEVGAATAGLFINLIPVFVAVMAMIFLGEPVAAFHLVGLALIFAGMGIGVARLLR